VPAFGIMPGVAQAKLPGTDAAPPLNVEADSVWPYVMAEAVGHSVTSGTCTAVILPGPVATVGRT